MPKPIFHYAFAIQYYESKHYPHRCAYLIEMINACGQKCLCICTNWYKFDVTHNPNNFNNGTLMRKKLLFMFLDKIIFMLLYNTDTHC